MPLFNVTHTVTLTAESPEAAALEVERLLATPRPKRFSVQSDTSDGPVLIQTNRGVATRIA